jgi:7-carboxy-7-deazaguanine synthase
MPVDEIITWITNHGSIKHVVLTGGEPMLTEKVIPLAEEIKRSGRHITIETAGTIYRELPVDLFSISPKLSNSRPTRGSEAWKRRHEELRMKPDIIAELMRDADHQLKFVVSQRSDLDEIDTLIERLNPTPSKVMLMPEGRSTQRLDESSGWVVEACMKRGWRFCDRLHVRLFGDTRGT